MDHGDTMSEADARRDALASIRRAKFEQRTAEQRESFGTIANAVEKAGFWKAAREIRKETEAAIARMQEQNAEMETFYAERDGLAEAKR